MKIRESKDRYHVIELEEGDFVQLLVPASMGRTAVHLIVMNGKLEISGGASVISEISGEGMRKKFKD